MEHRSELEDGTESPNSGATVIYVVGDDEKLIHDTICRFQVEIADKTSVKLLPMPKSDVCRASLEDNSNQYDPENSFYHQLNFVQRRNTALVIIIFNWRNEIASDEIHHRDLEDFWIIGTQLGLEKFSEVLLTVKTKMNEKQRDVLQNKLGMKFKGPFARLRATCSIQ